MNATEKARLTYALDTYAAAVELKDKRIAELERDKEELEYALDTYAAAVELKNKQIEKQYTRIAESVKILERLLTDAVRFIAYAQSKGVYGGEAIAKEIEENLNQGELCKI